MNRGPGMRWALPIRVAGLLVTATFILGCGSAQPIPPSADRSSSWRTGEIIDTATKRAISSADLLRALSRYDVIYIGEEHYNPHHIEAAITILRALVESGRQPVLGMEMFGWDGQSAIDRYMADPQADRAVFLEEAQWKSNWGGEFTHYEPLVDFIKAQHLALAALNPPKGLIRRVVRVGLSEARGGEDWRRWRLAGEDIVDDPAYRAKIMDQLRRCHGGGGEEDYQRMYEASMVRDEAMAKTLAALVGPSGDRSRVVVSYTGGGHIQYGLPVPSRVARRVGTAGVRSVTIYLTALDPGKPEEIEGLLQEPIADYVWLTPAGTPGPLQRCR